MFRKPGDGTFLGRENVPNDPPDQVRGDSPRQTWNRNSQIEQNADEVIRKLEPRLVLDASGHEIQVPALAGTKEGWTELGAVREKPPTHNIWIEPAHESGGFSIPAKEHRQACSVPDKALLAKGWVKAGACTKGREARPPMSDEAREHHQFQLGIQAHELRRGEYKTGRRLFNPDDGVYDEVADDKSMTERVHPRGTTTPKIEKPNK